MRGPNFLAYSPSPVSLYILHVRLPACLPASRLRRVPLPPNFNFFCNFIIDASLSAPLRLLPSSRSAPLPALCGEHIGFGLEFVRHPCSVCMCVCVCARPCVQHFPLQLLLFLEFVEFCRFFFFLFPSMPECMCLTLPVSDVKLRAGSCQRVTHELWTHLWPFHGPPHCIAFLHKLTSCCL